MSTPHSGRGTAPNGSPACGRPDERCATRRGRSTWTPSPQHPEPGRRAGRLWGGGDDRREFARGSAPRRTMTVGNVRPPGGTFLGSRPIRRCGDCELIEEGGILAGGDGPSATGYQESRGRRSPFKCCCEGESASGKTGRFRARRRIGAADTSTSCRSTASESTRPAVLPSPPMKVVEGTTLARRPGRRPLGRRARRHELLDADRPGSRRGHRRGVPHRDLKSLEYPHRHRRPAARHRLRPGQGAVDAESGSTLKAHRALLGTPATWPRAGRRPIAAGSARRRTCLPGAIRYTCSQAGRRSRRPRRWTDLQVREQGPLPLVWNPKATAHGDDRLK